ncbi:LacI family DNA-binding transcriptional regulator, partial [Peptoniphilus duerdenii]
GVEEIGRMYKYDILLSSSYGDSEVEVKFAKLLLQKQVEGIIVISDTLNTKLLYRLEESKIPYINVNRFYNVDEHYTVGVNHKDGTYQMTNYLVENGHKNIGLLYVRKDFDRTEEKIKEDGYLEALEEHGLVKNTIGIEGIREKDVAGIMDKVEEKIKSGVTAFVTTQDELGIHLQNALLDRGYKIPEDVSVTGYGATEMTELTRPKLTSVKVPYYDIGAVAIRRILKEIKKEESEDKVYLPARIVERDSVKKIK